MSEAAPNNRTMNPSSPHSTSVGSSAADIPYKDPLAGHQQLWAGLDIGSTTVKLAVIDPKTHAIIYGAYLRHDANQAETAYALLERLREFVPDTDILIAMCGSGAEPFCLKLGCTYVQEVIACGYSVTTLYPQTSSVLELGGQDAKMLFLTHDTPQSAPVVSDMRMNGVCAGGTGAFLDQMAQLLNIKPEELNDSAMRGSAVYPVSGRCGVFAKTDIQRLLAAGARKEDIALSIFHAVVSQTVSGLAQGATIHPPLLMLGGPLAFNTKLREVFAERLSLADGQIIIPAKAELIVAAGAALYAGQTANNQPINWSRLPMLRERTVITTTGGAWKQQPFFSSAADRSEFKKRHQLPDYKHYTPASGETVTGFLGIDAGSTTVKFVLINESGTVLYRFYQPSNGESFSTLQAGLCELKRHYTDHNATLDIKGLGATGYGELLVARAFGADYHSVETVAHAHAAGFFFPDASFVIDVGGQDMKAIRLENGIVTDICLNEACSAGCGSFVETFARALNIAVTDIAETAFSSNTDLSLGSRCTVFMNSLVTTEQRAGRTTADIIGGICRSIIENIFTKVIRPAETARMGNHIVVQGGTFRNDAILRALEQYTGAKVSRAPYPGEMGAIGIALLTQQAVQARSAQPSAFIGFDAVARLRIEYLPPSTCTRCANACVRTIIKFNDGTTYVTGNRCEKGDSVTTAALPAIVDRSGDLITLRNNLFFATSKPTAASAETTALKIGIPRVLEFYQSYPFWSALFAALGYTTVLSPASNRRIYETGMHLIPSDTICFPAKLVHGHIEWLIKNGVNRIFFPMMVESMPWQGHAEGRYLCPIVEGYPLVINSMHESCAEAGVTLDTPLFRFNTPHNRYEQVKHFLHSTFGTVEADCRRAYAVALAAQSAVSAQMHRAGNALLENNGEAVVIAGRPYQYDQFVNHGLAAHFVRRGIAVLPLDALSDLESEDLNQVRPEIYNPFHAAILAAAVRVAKSPRLHLVLITSFGCGHDAVLTDEIIRILAQHHKSVLTLKLDESSSEGPIRIRIDSFLETIKTRARSASAQRATIPAALETPYAAPFVRADRKKRTVLIPNLSAEFSQISRAVFEREGYAAEVLPMAGPEAIALGKQYVHNDICYPAQITIGEALHALRCGSVKPEFTAVAVAKNCRDCRAGQYCVLARKALDEAGFPQVPLITTGADTKNIHPGFALSPLFGLRMLWGLASIDRLHDMLHRCRPYEVHAGDSLVIFTETVNDIAAAITHAGPRQVLRAVKRGVARFNCVPLTEAPSRPRVLVIGEILMNFHPAANNQIVDFLESQGMEVVLPHMVPFFQKDHIRILDGAKRSFLMQPIRELISAHISMFAIAKVLKTIDHLARAFKYHEHPHDGLELLKSVEGIIDPSLVVGEGWLIPAEISSCADRGVAAAVILQPFGCLPNQITGRGLLKVLRKKHPAMSILSIDYDPDTSRANIESRLHMLVMSVKQRAARAGVVAAV